MTTFRRTHTIEYIEWHLVFCAYEELYDARIDGAIPQPLFDERSEEIGRRLGACYVYDAKHPHGHMKFRDEILSLIGISLGYEEVV